MQYSFAIVGKSLMDSLFFGYLRQHKVYLWRKTGYVGFGPGETQNANNIYDWQVQIPRHAIAINLNR